jgi:hypothetical protein
MNWSPSDWYTGPLKLLLLLLMATELVPSVLTNRGQEPIRRVVREPAPASGGNDVQHDPDDEQDLSDDTDDQSGKKRPKGGREFTERRRVTDGIRERREGEQAHGDSGDGHDRAKPGEPPRLRLGGHDLREETLPLLVEVLDILIPARLIDLTAEVTEMLMSAAGFLGCSNAGNV